MSSRGGAFAICCITTHCVKELGAERYDGMPACAATGLLKRKDTMLVVEITSQWTQLRKALRYVLQCMDVVALHDAGSYTYEVVPCACSVFPPSLFAQHVPCMRFAATVVVYPIKNSIWECMVKPVWSLWLLFFVVVVRARLTLTATFLDRLIDERANEANQDSISYVTAGIAACVVLVFVCVIVCILVCVLWQGSP
jgi:hypothetical protein